MINKEVINYINPYISKSIEYIDENIKSKITIDEVCKYVNLSKYYFLRIFKKQTGISPYSYILNCKIESVKNDLYEDIDINTIVDDYGFYDVSHLNKSFSKKYGMTPLEYKRNCIINNK